MGITDFVIFIVYLMFVFGVGVFFYYRNESREDYYVGSRNIKPFHVGLSVVATDVGGGFSIGLAGLGYTIGLSGSWMLFTGLVGAWLSAVLIIPKLKKVDAKHGMLTFPDFLRNKYGHRVALFAAVISGIGYMLFTGGQVLAGAKLASNTLFARIPLDIDPMFFSLIIIAGIILIYTVLGGLKAVIYTDTIQWIVLLSGLIFIAVPFALKETGGLVGLRASLPEDFFSLGNVTFVQVFNWMVTIVPIWLIAMTLYQRMYACKDEKDAKKAWFIAGLFEYPIMAFVGVFLGMVSRIFFPEVDSEMGLPLLLRDVLPIGLKGIIIASYFSAIMSTADSCLIASSGNITNDIFERYFTKNWSHKDLIRLSQVITLVVGIIAIVIASSFQSVLGIILDAYSFMAAGLFIPTLAAYFSKRPHPTAAIASMIAGGSFTLYAILFSIELPYGLHPSFFGISLSAIVFYSLSFILKKPAENN